MNKCHFCKKEKNLIKAHIIPRGFFKDMLYEKTTSSINMIEHGKHLRNAPSSGIYDPDILCGECDNFLGNEYDKYGQSFLLNTNFDEYKRDNRYVFCKNEFDYNRLQKFLISVLWRASISNQHVYHKVKLGEKYEPLCLDYIKDSKENSVNPIPTYLFKVMSGGIPGDIKDKAKKIIQGPFSKHLDGIKFYVFIFGGFYIFYKVDQRQFSSNEWFMLNKNKCIMPEQPFCREDIKKLL